MASRTSTNIWDRTSGDADVIPRQVFWLTVALWSTMGILAAAFAAYMSRDMHPSWPLMIGSFLVAMLGIFGASAAAAANSFSLATLCYFFIAAPMGFMLGPVVALYTAASVLKILAVTSLLTVGLGLFGALFPKSLEGFGVWLFGALWLLIIAQFMVVIGASFGITSQQSTLHFLDWIGVAIFSGLIIFDFNRASRVQSTHVNALLVAIQIFLDFANIFVRLLELFGKTRD